MNQISYKTILDLGFHIDETPTDIVYFEEYGYPYKIITKKLTKTIYLKWHQESRTCTLYRINSPKKGDILATMPVRDFDHLQDILAFFTNDPKL